MRSVLLDTSAYSALMRGHAEIASAARHADAIYLTPVVLGELLAGFRRGKYRRKNETELRAFLATPRVELGAADGETSDRYAVILTRSGRRARPFPPTTSGSRPARCSTACRS